LILINDCSPDGGLTSKALVEIQNSTTDISIKVLSMSKNVGPGMARNEGWNISTQPYIAFLDADDIWHPQKLQIQYAWMKLNPTVALSGHLTSEFMDDETLPLLKIEPKDMMAEQINLTKMLISNRFATRSVMIQRILPFRFMNKNFAEDQLLWLEIILSGRKAVVLDQILAYSGRPEFSIGGYSGSLWIHEKRSLVAWSYLYEKKSISFLVFCLASMWSYTKYLRRVLIRLIHSKLPLRS
jgi:glycosyltransferase involved in cell wall biosynthesis